MTAALVAAAWMVGVVAAMFWVLGWYAPLAYAVVSGAVWIAMSVRPGDSKFGHSLDWLVAALWTISALVLLVDALRVGR